MFFTYILYSPNHKRQYVGACKDVKVRLNEHNSGKTKSTKPYVPWVLIYSEEYSTFAEARKREVYLKTAAGRRWRKENINWPSSSTG